MPRSHQKSEREIRPVRTIRSDLTWGGLESSVSRMWFRPRQTAQIVEEVICLHSSFFLDQYGSKRPRQPCGHRIDANDGVVGLFYGGYDEIPRFVPVRDSGAIAVLPVIVRSVVGKPCVCEFGRDALLHKVIKGCILCSFG